MAKKQKAQRIIETYTGAWEKRNLPKLAQALPHWINPDHLTIAGLFAGFIIGAGYLLYSYSSWWLLLSNFGLVLHWYADSLDGTLARVRKIEREKYGYFVDHLCDAWTTFVICLFLGMSPLMHLDVALFIAIGYLLLNVYAHILAYTQGQFPLSYGRLGPTEVRIIIGVINFIVIFYNPIIWLDRTLFDLIGFVVGCVFILIFIGVGIKDALKLDKLDRISKNSGKTLL
jgi:archaetidylinositol phosphate synthase